MSAVLPVGSLSTDQLMSLLATSKGETAEIIRAELHRRDEAFCSDFGQFVKAAFLPAFGAKPEQPSKVKCSPHQWLRPDNGVTECNTCGATRFIGEEE